MHFWLSLIHISILMLRYLKETEETDEEYRGLISEWLWKELEEIQKLKGECESLAEETQYEPHVIYTLLDPDRLDCLCRTLEEAIET